MKRILTFAAAFAGLLAGSPDTTRAEFWPGWRGPRGDGTCIE